MGKKKKGRWRRPRTEELGGDKPSYTLDPQPKPEKKKSVTVFLVGLDPKTKRILSAYKIDKYPPTWVLPSGRLEPGESPKETLWRETYQETGCKLDCVIDEKTQKFTDLATAEIVAIYEVNQLHEKHVFVDILDPAQAGKMTIRETEEIGKVGWLTLDRWINMPSAPYSDAEIDDRREYKRETHLELILVALKFLGRLEEFGFHEASVEDYITGAIEDTFTPATV